MYTNLFNHSSWLRIVFVISCFVLLTGTKVLGQSRTVTGKVTDGETGEPLPGVSVVIKGTAQGTITDIDGNYSISVGSDQTLSFSFIGYTGQEVEVGSQSTINVGLPIDVQALEEVVVVDYGYGTVKKKDFTGSVASLSGREMAKIPVASTAQALSGRLPGVNILTTDGSPDAEVVIRVRGGGSITQSNDPLYVVDGFIVNSIRDIPPSDIESINVLKDAAATAIYGAQAANGVIVITTLTPREGRTRISYNGFVQVKMLPDNRAYEVLSPYEFVLANYEYEKLRGQSAVDQFERLYGTYEDLELYKNKPGRDWQEDLLGDPQYSYYHNVSANGGTESTKYSLSLTTNDDQGILPGNGYNRNVANFKLMQKVSDKVSFDAMLRITNTKVTGSGTSGASQLRIKDIIQTRPTNGIAEDLELDLGSVASDNDFQSYLLSRLEPTDLVDQDWRERTDNNYVYGVSASWDIINGLRLQSKFTGSQGFRETLRFYGPETSESFNNGGSLPLGYIRDNIGDSYRVQNSLQYDFPFLNKENHNLNLMVGQEIYSSGGSTKYIKSTGFRESITPEEMFANFGLGNVLENSTSESTRSNRFSLYGRLDYQLSGKYLATLTFRSDASSKFSKNNRIGVFPAAALGWKISEESFMSGLSFFDELKLRVSYGTTGNDRIDSDAFLILFSPSTFRGPGFNNEYNNYYETSSNVLYNPDLVWETTINRNAGLDFSLFAAKVAGSIDFYYNTTNDLLLQSAIPTSSGFGYQWNNIGNTSNKGIDFGVTAYVVDKSDLSVSVTANLGLNDGKIEELDGTTNRFFASNWASTDLISYDDYYLEVGGNVGDIYGYVTDGYYTEDDFESYDPVSGEYILKEGVTNSTNLTGNANIRPGFLKLKDINGDSVVNDQDRKVIGNGLPDAQGGFGLNVRYKGWDAQFFFNWQIGNDVYNTNKIDFNQLRRVGYGNMLTTMSIDNRYTYLDVDGTYTDTPGEIVTDLADLAELNRGKEMWSHASFGRPVVHSWAIEDGSFLRLNQVTVGYTLPAGLLGKIGVTNFRIYATGNNLHIWTKYSGYDPEVSTSRSSNFSALIRGMDYNSFPRSRSYTLGVNVTF